VDCTALLGGRSYLGASARVISSADARIRQNMAQSAADVSPSAHLFSSNRKPLARYKSGQASEPWDHTSPCQRGPRCRASVRERAMVCRPADPSSPSQAHPTPPAKHCLKASRPTPSLGAFNKDFNGSTFLSASRHPLPRFGSPLLLLPWMRRSWCGAR